MTGTSGFLKKTAANTWALDTNTYLTGITSTMVTTALGYTPVNVTALADYVTLATAQTISALKTMTAGLKVSGRTNGSTGGDDEGITIGFAANGLGGLTIGNPTGVRSVFYFRNTEGAIPFWRYNNGTTSFDIQHPAKSGTIALTSDVSTAIEALDSSTEAVSSGYFLTGVTITNGKITARTQNNSISGSAGSLTTVSKTAWGQTYWTSGGVPTSISGDMSSVGKMTFTAKTSKSTSGNVLEVVTIDGVTYLHSVLPFVSDSFISAGGVSSGGGTAGADLPAVWTSLRNVSTSASEINSTIKIAEAHIPDMSGTYGYLKSGDVSGVYLPLNVGAGKTITSTSNAPLNINSTTTSTNEVGFRYQLRGENKAFFGYNASADYGAYMYNYNGPHRLGITDAGVAHFDNNALLHAGNYTSYVNTTNFPGLNKTGTVTSITLTQGTGISITNSGTAITSTGTRTISLASGVCTAGTYYKTTVDTYGRVTSGWYADLSAAINGDLGIGTSDPTDADYYIAQYAGGGTTTTSYHRRPHSALYNYIKGKLDSVYIPTTRTVNSKALSSNITLSLDDIADGATRKLANYLPLTGGTISNSVYYPLQVNNSTSGATAVGIQFNGAGTRLGNIYVNGVDSTLHFYYGSTDNVVLHSGNYTSYVNSTNFPGLAGVRSVSINGDYLRVNTNGTNSDLTVSYATQSGRVTGSYTGNGGQQKPNYFGTNKVGFLMMNTTVNGNSNYKDWIIMDCYSANDVGGGVAFGVNRQALGAYIMRSAAARDAWAESAELYGTHNLTKSVITGLIGTTTYAAYNANGYLPLTGGAIQSASSYARLRFVTTSTEAYVQAGTSSGNAGTLYLTGYNASTGSTLAFQFSNVYAWNGSSFSQILHAGNYSSYALPLTGGTMTLAYYGSLTFKTTAQSATPYSYLRFTGTDTSAAETTLGFLGFYGVETPAFMNAAGNSYPLYHSGNSNSTSVNWSAKNLTVAYNSYLHFLNPAGNGDCGYIIGYEGVSGNTLSIHGSETILLRTGGTTAIQIDSSQNVGIGTTSPAYKLDVAGKIRSVRSDGWGVLIGEGGNCIDGINSSGYSNLHLNYSSAGNVSFCIGGGNVGIGINPPSYKLHVDGGVYSSAAYYVGSGGSNSYLASDSANNIYLHNSSGYPLVCDGLVVRRGANHPTGTLGSSTFPWGGVYSTTGDFSGNITMANNTTLGAYDTGGTRRTLLGLDGGNGVYLAWGASAAGYTTYINGNTLAFNYGTSHTQSLSIGSSGTVRFTCPNFIDFQILRSNSSGSAAITYYAGNQTTNYWCAGADPAIYSDTSLNNRFFWYYNGTYKAYITNTGSFVAVGAITAGSASDARLKTNISTLSDSDAKTLIMALRPVTFTWNDKATELYDQYKGDDLGFVAQEVENVLPVAIGTIFEKYKRLDQTKFIAPLVKVAQDHESRIRQLEVENRELRKQLNMN